MNLYFRTSNFESNKELAKYIFSELEILDLNPTKPQSEEFMYIIEATIENELISFYMGKNDEASEPTLWQIWPEQSISFLKRIFGKVNKEPEEKAKKYLEKIIGNIQGVSSVEWGI